MVFLANLINQLVYHSQFALLTKILNKQELVDGNIAFNIAYQGSDCLFNAISGVFITIVGIYTCYVYNSIILIIGAILYSMLSDKTSSVEKIPFKNIFNNSITDLFKGLKIWKELILKNLLYGVIMINFSTTMIFAVLPDFAKNPLQYS